MGSPMVTKALIYRRFSTIELMPATGLYATTLGSAEQFRKFGTWQGRTEEETLAETSTEST